MKTYSVSELQECFVPCIVLRHGKREVSIVQINSCILQHSKVAVPGAKRAN